jgi:hypothetical protein
MGKSVSTAAICMGLLCTGLCAAAYFTQHRPGETGDPEFWKLAGVGLLVLALGVAGLLGRKPGNPSGRDNNR